MPFRFRSHRFRLEPSVHRRGCSEPATAAQRTRNVHCCNTLHRRAAFSLQTRTSLLIVEGVDGAAQVTARAQIHRPCTDVWRCRGSFIVACRYDQLDWLERALHRQKAVAVIAICRKLLAYLLLLPSLSLAQIPVALPSLLASVCGRSA